MSLNLAFLFVGFLFFLGLVILWQTIGKWNKKNASSRLEELFTKLLIGITVATVLISSGIGLLIWGIEKSSYSNVFPSLSLDGETLFGILTLWLVMPAAFASALVVISLGKNQDELTKKEIKAHEEREQKEIRESIHNTEVKFINLTDCYQKALYAIRDFSDLIDSGCYDLFGEHFFPCDMQVSNYEYVRAKFNVEKKVKDELLATYPVELIESNQKNRKSIFKRGVDWYISTIDKLVEARTAHRVNDILISPPRVYINSPEAREFLVKLNGAEKAFTLTLKRLLDAINAASLDSDCASVWNRRMHRTKSIDGTFLKKISGMEFFNEKNLPLFLDSIISPELYKIKSRLEEVIEKLEYIFEEKRRRLARDNNEFDLQEYYKSFDCVLKKFFVDQNRSSRGGNEDSNILEYIKYNSIPFCKLRLTTPAVNSNNNFRLSYNSLGLLMLVIGVSLPTYQDILDGINLRRIIGDEDFDAILKQSVLLGRILPTENKYYEYSRSMDISDQIIEFTIDDDRELAGTGDSDELFLLEELNDAFGFIAEVGCVG